MMDQKTLKEKEIDRYQDMINKVKIYSFRGYSALKTIVKSIDFKLLRVYDITLQIKCKGSDSDSENELSSRRNRRKLQPKIQTENSFHNLQKESMNKILQSPTMRHRSSVLKSAILNKKEPESATRTKKKYSKGKNDFISTDAALVGIQLIHRSTHWKQSKYMTSELLAIIL